MEIFLIRHTELAIDEGICYGYSDVPLSADFTERVKEVKSKLLPLLPFDKVYSSPSQRCYLLAKQLSDKSSIVLDNRIKELNFGNWEMKRWGMIEASELQLWYDDFVNVKCPGGESYLDLFQRSKRFMTEVANEEDRKVLVVSHGGVIRGILSMVLDLPLEKSFRFQISHGGISKIKKIGKDIFVVEFINR